VAPAREKLHVVLQVREAGSLKTVWSREYDRASGDLATLRGAASMDVAGAIGARITAAERGRLERVPTKNREAYDLFLQARRARAMLSRDSMARTISLLKQAVELDPRFAEAMASISYLLMLGNDPRNVQEALDWAQKALAVDADSAAAHQSLATAFGNKGAFTKSRAEFKRAIEINPNDTVTLNNYSVLEAQLGHFEESLQLARRGLELNPYFTEAYFHVSIPLQFLASREQVSKWLELWRVRFPRAYRVPMAQLLFEVSGGNYQGALDGARKILETYKGNPEIELLVSDLAMVCGAPDAEEILRRVSNGALDPAYLQFMILPESPRARLAWFLLKRGDKAGAEKMLADAERVAMEHWRSGVQAPGLPVELAAIHAMRGDGNEAANWYQRAFDAGWRERLHEKLDPMLIPAASHPRFRAVVQQIEEDVRRKAAESREVKALFEETVPTLPPPPVKK
jgi:tetratricopeptide (TPR) repeat protein